MSRVRDELQLLAKKHGGTVTPQQVVEFATNPKTALHRQFLWDDTEAARRFRLMQAAKILRVTVAYEPRVEKNVRVFVSLPEDRGADGYRLTVDVLSDAIRRKRLLETAMAELAAFEKKYSDLKELAGVLSAIRQARTGRRKTQSARSRKRSAVA